MADWRHSLLRAIGAPDTVKNNQFLAQWQRWEGGHTNNDARFNWLNTTRNAPGATGSINSVGVKAFGTRQSGINAAAATLTDKSGIYNDILAGLQSGDPFAAKPVRGLSTWLSGSPDSSAGQKYAAKVLGTPIDTIKEQAGQTYDTSPAKIVNDPNPLNQLKLKQQAATMVLNMGNDIQANTGMLSELANLRMTMDLAAADVARSEAAARSYGGTTMKSLRSDNPVEWEAADEQLTEILRIADAQIGKPYVWGAETPTEGGFDCSGLIDYAFKKAGVKLPGRLTTQTAMNMGRSVQGQPLKPGDWIVTNKGGHMVMYVGNNQVIAAPRRGEVVQYQPVDAHLKGAIDVRRVLK
jgi:cell wall-associated NlpC family hydrolase